MPPKNPICLNIAICDDCSQDALLLASCINGHKFRIYSDTESLLKDVEKEKITYDLYLLDIYIDNSMNGIELAKRLRTLDPEAVICFISSSDAFYREAYDLYAVQYLIKPIQAEALEQLFGRVSQNLSRSKEQSLSFKWRGQTGSIPYHKILFISSREHALYIHCKDGTVQECRGKLSEIEKQVCGDVFLRCHQSFLVNMYQADRLSGNELMVSGYSVPISRRYYGDVKRRYQEILFEGVE
ncbi:MAG: response regulator transcription factor [Lachnospiraceae bacterium]|nr:response regulator transcription factor [Lachnospiraceae bacterium]